MRAADHGLLVAIVLLLGLGATQRTHEHVARARPAAEPPATLDTLAARAPRVAAGTENAGPQPAGAADAASPELPRHRELARRAREGSIGASLELARLLDACVERDETRLVMHVVTSDMDRTPACTDADSCAAVERVYEEMHRSLAQWRDVDADCRTVPTRWLRTRGRWLRRAAELGDGEARACYALAAAELAPPPTHRDYARWLEQWRVHALPWAWQAWRDGEPRAALALARIYGPDVYFRGDASEVADADIGLQYRFERLLADALDLDPVESDVAASALAIADTLSAAEQADADSWISAQLPRFAAGFARSSRTPDACWQHFAMFERSATSTAAAH